MNVHYCVLNLKVGTLYDNCPTTIRTIDGVKTADRFPLGRYRIIGVARDVHTLDCERVVYEGVDGVDMGKLLVASLMDFATRFLEVKGGKENEKETGEVDVKGEEVQSTPRVNVDIALVVPQVVEKIADNMSHGKDY